MARNIEIKAKLDCIETCKRNASEISGCEPTVIVQEDIFFKCNDGRLKLRFFEKNKGQLIVYNRPNNTGPKISDYRIYETDNPQALKKTLEVSNGIIGIVKKIRYLYLTGRTRIHVDSVEGLGDYIELEVVLSESEQEADGVKEVKILMEKLCINKNQLVDGAYLDLLTGRNV